MGKKIPEWQKRRLEEVLRQLRIEKGLTQGQLGKLIGQNQSYVSKFETGQRQLKILELRVVCRALGLSLTQFAQRLERSLD